MKPGLKRFALLGKNIHHSQSQRIYEELLNKKIQFKIFDTENKREDLDLKAIFQQCDYLNITAPYKRIFLDQVDLSSEAILAGSINCLKKDLGIFKATSSDYLALKFLLRSFFIKLSPKKTIILGDGAMSEITQKLLTDYQVFSRGKGDDIKHFDLGFLPARSLVINTCSRDFTYQGSGNKDCFFWDYNYDFPEHSKRLPQLFLRYFDGLNFLKLQAQFALEFFEL